MIDPENEVYDRLAKQLREKFPGIDIASEYVKTPSTFPHVSVVCTDNFVSTRTQTCSSAEVSAVVAFQIDVYSNKREGKKTECKTIAKEISDAMYKMNFTRLAFTPVPNMEDATIYRITARYRAETDGKNFYRR